MRAVLKLPAGVRERISTPPCRLACSVRLTCNSLVHELLVVLQLHAAVVELSAGARARIKYSTVQNWYAGDEEGVGGIYNFVTKRGLCHGAGSHISWTQARLRTTLMRFAPATMCMHVAGECITRPALRPFRFWVRQPSSTSACEQELANKAFDEHKHVVHLPRCTERPMDGYVRMAVSKVGGGAGGDGVGHHVEVPQRGAARRQQRGRVLLCGAD